MILSAFKWAAIEWFKMFFLCLKIAFFLGMVALGYVIGQSIGAIPSLLLIAAIWFLLK